MPPGVRPDFMNLCRILTIRLITTLLQPITTQLCLIGINKKTFVLMKKLILYVLPLLSLCACSDDDAKQKEADDARLSMAGLTETCGVDLTLVSMHSNNLADQPVIAGNDMEWQETIHLDPNGDFSKTRTRDGVIRTEGGTFDFVVYGGIDFLELTYTTPQNDLLADCSADGKEAILIVSATEFKGVWAACDGPELRYEKTDSSCSE
jgi:hypothetical protein